MNELYGAPQAVLEEAGPCLAGAQISAADIYLLMPATCFDPHTSLLAACPAAARCVNEVAARPALRRRRGARG